MFLSATDSIRVDGERIHEVFHAFRFTHNLESRVVLIDDRPV